jgi:hypothetical protein
MEAGFRRRNDSLSAFVRTEDLRHKAGDAKIQKVNEVFDYRLEDEQFPRAINQERAEYLRREMYDRERTALADRVKAWKLCAANTQGRTAAFASTVGAAIILVQILLHFLK